MDKPTGKSIVINPVTRIEGHARITIQLNEAGEISEALFHVNEFRGFEKFCEGRLYSEMPVITPRICGICPVSHAVTSVKACEMIQGIHPTQTGNLLRRLIHLGQHISSHALSFFHLSAPDFLLGYDADPSVRNIIGLASSHPEIARRGIRLRQFGQEISERITGKKIHVMGIVPGGMAFPLTEDNRQALQAWIPEALETTQLGLDIIKRFQIEQAAMVAEFAPSPTHYLGTVDAYGGHDVYDGKLRWVAADGSILEDQVDPIHYLDFIAERSVGFSYLKYPYFKPLGFEQGRYRVGPLARLNVATRMRTPLAQQEFEAFRALSQGQPVHGTFYFHYARLIEVLAAVEEVQQILANPIITGSYVQHHGKWNNPVGIGSSEAPRGTLFHHYETDKDGKLVMVNMLIATAQNNPAMNQSITDVAKRFVDVNEVQEGMLNRVESAIRCYDPCLSCSTHAIGKMPFHIDIVNAAGECVKQIDRSSSAEISVR